MRAALFWVTTQQESNKFEPFTLDDGTDSLSRNVGNKLPLLDA